MERQLTNEQHVREEVRKALGTIRPLVTIPRDGLVITVLEWGAAGQAAYETATAAANELNGLGRDGAFVTGIQR